MPPSDGRLPRFSRFEYIHDLLIAINKTGIQGSDLKTIQKVLTDRKELFEQAKFIAVGKRRSIASGGKIASDLTRDCISFAIKGDLVRKNVPKEGRFTLTKNGVMLLQDQKNDEMSNKFLKNITSIYLSTYPRAFHVFMAIFRMEGNQVDIPDTRNRGNLDSEQLNKILGVRCDAVSLRILKDLLDQAGFLNWYTHIKGVKKPVWTIYTTSRIIDIDKIQNSILTGSSIMSEGHKYAIQINQCDNEEFEEAIWSEYINLTGNYEEIPVYYWHLRSKVCYKLRISDSVYYNKLITLKNSNNYRFNWASGSMSGNKAMGNRLKNLPPIVSDGYYMVYVSLSKKKR